jgi:hypothetical protein
MLILFLPIKNARATLVRLRGAAPGVHLDLSRPDLSERRFDWRRPGRSGDTMAQEIDESIPYLNALKRSASPFAESVPSPASERDADEHPLNSASPDSVDQFQGLEKRHSSRHKCEGSAELCEEGCQVGTWATFSDISLHGCYLEAKATYPVGTTLHLKLEANGVRVQAKGCVRVCYPYLGMGIALVEMSDENRLRLRELLGTITRSSTLIEPTIISSTLASSTPVSSTIPSSTIIGPGIPASPAIADPTAVVQALTEFFSDRQVLTREGFLRILSESHDAKP